MQKSHSLKIILILWLAGLCAAAQFAKIGHILPELQVLYPNAESSLGFLLSLISLVGALLGLIAGVLVGHIGSRSVLLMGLVAGSLISLIQSFNLPLNLLLASRVLEGASHLAIVVAAPTLVAQHSNERMRAAAMTLWGTFFGVSFALTAWLGLPLVAAKGVDALFFAHALVTGAAALLVAVMIPKPAKPAENKTPNTRPFSVSDIYQQHKQAWSSPTIAAPAAGWIFYTITFVALLAVLPGLMPIEQRAFTAASLPLASIASSMTLGIVLLKRFSAVQVICTGFISAIGFALLLLLIPSEPLVAILLFASLGLVQGASFAAIPQLNKTAAKQALANGTLAQAGNIGNLCGTPLLLLLISSGGITAMIILMVTCYLAAITAHLIFARRRAKALA
jgi:predicted MFS family arabinose efflux permease